MMMDFPVQLPESEIKARREAALGRRQRKRRMEGRVYRTLWGKELPDQYPGIDPAGIKRILIMQRNQRIGDVVVGMGITGGLRTAIPDAHIAVMVPEALVELASVDGAVNEVISQSNSSTLVGRFLRDWWTIRGGDWDLVIVLGIQASSLQLAARSGAKWQIGYSYNHRGDNLNRSLIPHHSCNRSGWEYDPQEVPHIVDFWAEMCQRGGVSIIPSDWEQVELPVMSDQVAEIFWHHQPGLTIGLHPFSGNPMREWLLGRFAMLGRELIDKYGAHLVITGGPADRDKAEWLREAIGGDCTSAAGKVAIIETWSAIRSLDVVISVDTAMIHMAAAVGVPVISLFGPGDPAIWGPRGQLDRVIQGFPLCQRCKGGRCVQSRVYCMEAITMEPLLAKVETVIQECGDRKVVIDQIVH